MCSLQRVLILSSSLVVAAGCADRPRDDPPPGNPVITTAALEHGYRGLSLSIQLEALAAEPPVSWSFASPPPATLAWLSLTTDGQLHGTPAVVLAGEQLTVRATDAGARSTEKTFAVVVDSCVNGAEATCSFASADACTVGTATCAAGQFGSCTGAASTSAARCGAACLSCGEGADGCAAGSECRCGSGAACAGAHTTAARCTGGACVNTCAALWGDCDANPQNGCETSLTTSTSCGACGTPCTAPTHGTASCAGGTCTAGCPANMTNAGGACVCNGGLTPCGSATTCVDTSTDESNCGSCGRVCPGDTIGDRFPFCAAGSCTLRCPSGSVWCAAEASCLPSGVPCGGGTCFVAGTAVLLADGTARAIESIAAGDAVLALDPATGALTPAIVERPLVHPDTPRLLRLNGRLTTTPEHRFFVGGAWVAAGDLRPGDVLVTAAPAAWGFDVGEEVVTSIEPIEGEATTYNLELEEVHDYFAGGVLVHNAKQIP